MIHNIAVIGAGVMGGGIAYTAAAAGYAVTLQDISPESLATAKNYMSSEMMRSLERGYLTNDQAKQVNEIHYALHIEEAVQSADIVIEAVFENMELKIEVFKKLDLHAPSHAVLATNTSTMSPTEIAAQTNRPENCLALHFFNPVHKIKLVELVRGLQTSDETVSKSLGFIKRLGKEAVEVNEFPGFVTSRMNCLIGNEAMNMLMEGVATVEGIDKALKLGLNHPMGPLELADLVGLDTRLRNMEYLYQTLGEKYRPCPILAKYVKAGRLGRKTGAGFYEYTKS